MIGKLKGRIDELGDDSVLLDVSGVGYIVFCGARTLATLGSEGDAASLTIEMQVREDSMQLFGFSDKIEREWFRLLTSVQRVGAKMALVILGSYSPDQLAHAILAKDTTVFSRISGVGPKLAERIVTELKDKVGKMPTSSFTPTVAAKGSKKTAAKTEAAPSHTDDAISALVNLGYSRSEAYGAVMQAQQVEQAVGLDDLIKHGLKTLVRA